MRITLSQLEAFYWAAKLGSIHAAARHLHVTQPAVSARIRELESTLDVQLFDRSRQRATLTDTGQSALRHAEAALHSSRQLEHYGKDRKLGGKLRLGADECSANVSLSAVIAQIKEHYPTLALEITVDVGAVLNQKLNAGELDMALFTNPSTSDEVTDIFIGWMPFHWVAAPSLRITADPFRPEHARGQHIATHSPPSTLHTVVEQWLASGGVEMTGLSTTNSLALIARLVASGHAIGVLPVPLLQDMLSMGALRALPCEPPIAPARFHISYLTASHGAHIDAIVDIARHTLTRLNFLTPVDDASP
ncbi:Transcriptional regulator, LysR family [plant metagenome]|uniref:Transcriptional regulator, LysR family n=1 Tax=plant metagenome TaxID=1297885 RepID=A0A484S7K0_9ZZZZ